MIELIIYNIGDIAFSGCTSLSYITIPSSVTSIGNKAFYDCTSLSGILIPSSVISIGEGAFSGCAGLEKIEVDASNVVYDSREDRKKEHISPKKYRDQHRSDRIK